jgi:hypothetical protein
VVALLMVTALGVLLAPSASASAAGGPSHRPQIVDAYPTGSSEKPRQVYLEARVRSAGRVWFLHGGRRFEAKRSGFSCENAKRQCRLWRARVPGDDNCRQFRVVARNGLGVRTHREDSCFAFAWPEEVPNRAAGRPCQRINNPYRGTRYEGSDLRRIRAFNMGCLRARRVVRGAHYKALGMPPYPTLRFRWNGWRVVGDIRGADDRYRARKGERLVRWVF